MGQVIYYEVTEEDWSALNKDAFKAEDLLTKWAARRFGAGQINGSFTFGSQAGSPQELARAAIDEMDVCLAGASLPVSYSSAQVQVIIEESIEAGGWISIAGLEPSQSQ